MKLTYKKLDLNDDKDKKIMDRIISFDKNKDCLGDYDFYEVSDDYINLAVYIKNKLIGYVEIYHEDSVYYSKKGKYMITICIREEYQSIGLGDIILKQTINTLFNEFDAKTIDIEVVEDNYKCNKLVIKNHFIKDKKDTFLKKGEYVSSTHYVYTKDIYEKEQVHLKKYKKFI